MVKHQLRLQHNLGQTDNQMGPGDPLTGLRRNPLPSMMILKLEVFMKKFKNMILVTVVQKFHNQNNPEARTDK